MKALLDYLVKYVCDPIITVGMYVGLSFGNLFRLRMDHPAVKAIAIIVAFAEVCLIVFFCVMFVDIALSV